MSNQFEAKESSNVGWARYNPETQTLEVDFRNKSGEKNSTYAYENFPPDAWEAFRAAESKGQHFAYAIRPKYAGKKIWSR